MTTNTNQSDDGIVERLFAAIKHGDDEHREWLREAIGAFYAGEPVPEPRGKGRKEALISTLEAENAALTHDLTRSMETANEYVNECATLEAHLAAVEAENGRLRAALKPSAETKAAYIGEFTFTVEDTDDEWGLPITRKMTVPWTTTKEIMAAIRSQALASSDTGASE